MKNTLNGINQKAHARGIYEILIKDDELDDYSEELDDYMLFELRKIGRTKAELAIINGDLEKIDGFNSWYAANETIIFEQAQARSFSGV